MSSEIEWSEVSPGHHKGELKHEESAGIIYNDIYLCETYGEGKYYSLNVSYTHPSGSELCERHIANFKNSENAKLFAEIMHTKESIMVEDVVDSLQWLTNTRVNK